MIGMSNCQIEGCDLDWSVPCNFVDSLAFCLQMLSGMKKTRQFRTVMILHVLLLKLSFIN
jgi:hypothetical protein